MVPSVALNAANVLLLADMSLTLFRIGHNDRSCEPDVLLATEWRQSIWYEHGVTYCAAPECNEPWYEV